MFLDCIDYNDTIQDKLDRFFVNSFKSCGFSYEPLTNHVDLRNINTIFVNTGGGFWIIVQNDLIVGSAGLKIIDEIKGIGELKCMYVLPNQQKRGLGQKLLDKVLQESKCRDLNLIRLDVKVGADRALKLYMKNGFYEIPRYNDNQNDVIFMEKKIE